MENNQRPPVSFWYDDPNVLLSSAAELFPTGNMPLSQQMNAITRLVIVLSGMCYWYQPRITVLGMGMVTVAGIAAFYYHYTGMRDMKSYLREPFVFANTTVPSEYDDYSPDEHKRNKKDERVDFSVYQAPTPNNPFGNVLLTDIVDNPQRLPAPPAFIESVRDDITRQAVQMVQDMHPNEPNLTARLYGNMEDQLAFEQSLRPFQSNPCTTVAGDIATFMEFCYGNTASFRDGECVLGSKQRPRFV